MEVRNFGKRIDRLEASVNLTPRERKEKAFKEMMDYGQTLGVKTLNDLILFFREERWHREKGNKEAQAEIMERIRKYCEGDKVKIIDEKRMPREGDTYLDQLPFTITQNPNAPEFDTLNERFLSFGMEED
jgi:hypothetical protein